MIKQANFKLLQFVKSQSHHAMQVVLATIKDLLRNSLMRRDAPNTWTPSSSLVQAAVKVAEKLQGLYMAGLIVTVASITVLNRQCTCMWHLPTLACQIISIDM
jgi:hypothetical protein